MADATFAIDATSLSSARVDVKVRTFTFTIDEPADLGGTDAGPNPVEYVLGALAGCLNVVGHMIAQEMGFTIETLRIHIEGNLDPMGFLGKAQGVRPGFKEIRARLEVKTDASQEQLDQWIKTVEARCPVSDNLAHETPVTISYRC